MQSVEAREAAVGEERIVDIADLKLTDDPLCNSEDLRALMLEVILLFSSKVNLAASLENRIYFF